MKIKKYDSTNGWVQEYPEVNVGAIVVSNPNDASSSTFLRGDGTWATPTAADGNNYLTGVSGSGNGTVTFTRSGLSNLTWDASHSHSEYLPLAGGTMTGDLTVTSGNNNGIFIGNGGANITSVTPSSKDIVIQDVAQIRFGSASWDWNTWAGLAFNDSTEVLTIGGPASSVFSSNSNPPLIDVNFDGLNTSGLKVNNNTVWHDGIFEPIVDNLDVLPTYTSSNEDFIKYNTTERAIEVQGSDDSFGAVYPAIKTESGVSYKISFSIKSNTTTTSGGVYFRPQEYDSALPDGKTHIAGNATHSEVQEATRQLTSFYENQNIGTSWEQHSFFYTPTSTAVWFSLMFLNWTGLGTNSLFIKNLRVDAIQEDSADANTLDGLDSTQFVRSDQADTMTDTLTISAAKTTDDPLLKLVSTATGDGDAVIELEANDTGEAGIIFKNPDNTNSSGWFLGYGDALSEHFYLYDYQNSTARLVVGHNGNVGIGTTSPRQKLDVIGKIQVSNGLTLRDNSIEQHLTNGNANVAVNYYGYANGHTQFRDFDIYNGKGGLIAQFDGSSSNVGIGTTNPAYKLDVNGTARISSTVKMLAGTNYNENLRMSSSSNGYSSIAFGANPLTDTGTQTGQWTLVRYPQATHNFKFAFRHSSSDVMTMLTGGNVGIGTGSPLTKLNITGTGNYPLTGANGRYNYGQIHIDGTSSTTNDGHGITFAARDAVGVQAHITVSSDGSYGTKMSFGTTGSYSAGSSGRMVIDHTGRVGIGTSSPSDTLHIQGNQIISKTSTGGQNQIRFQEAGTTKTQLTSNYGDNKFYLYHEGDNVMVIDSLSATTFSGDLTVQGDLTINGTTTTLDTTVSTTDQWTVTNAGTDVATIINQTGTADILDVRDNGTSVFKVKDGGNVEMKTDSKFTVGASTTVNEAKIILDASNAGHPQIGLAENNDASWALGVDDLDNSFKIHGAASSTIPTIGGLTTPHLELDTTGNMWLQKRLYFTSNAYMEYNSTNDSIDFFFT